MKKAKITEVLTVVLLLMIIVSHGYFYLRFLRGQKRDVPASFALMDSIRVIQQKRGQFQDSLIFYDQRHEALTIKKDSIMHLDSLQWAGLRDSVRTSVRSRVAAKLRERATR